MPFGKLTRTPTPRVRVELNAARLVRKGRGTAGPRKGRPPKAGIGGLVKDAPRSAHQPPRVEGGVVHLRRRHDVVLALAIAVRLDAVALVGLLLLLAVGFVEFGQGLEERIARTRHAAL